MIQATVEDTILSDHILLIDDDNKLASMVADYLKSRGMTVEIRLDATTGMAALKFGDFDALVLDVMLPDIEGFEVCRRVRAESDIPILMLTARGDETDRIVGLEIGADDYLPKPFNPRELLARLRAILRRRRGPTTAGKPLLRFGRLEIDREAMEARVDGNPCDLTGYQLKLLIAMAERPGRALSRDALMDLTKGEQFEVFDRSIDVHVSRIRAAIEDNPKKPKRIMTMRGVGYLFTKSQD